MTALDDFDAAKTRTDVLDARMACFDAGKGSSIVFLHGNPTSSMLWRGVIPHVVGLGRCLAPDLIGMGASDKREPASGAAYRFTEHRRYLDALLDRLDIGTDVILVLHDWGSALGFDWANRHRDRVAGIAYTEAIVAPLGSWDDWPANARGIFQGMRSESGEKLVLDNNVFVERILPASMLHELTPDEHDAYRRPFHYRADRWPTLQWPREIPMEGRPADVVRIVDDYAAWLRSAQVPKLFLNAEPGSILVGRQREFCRTWPEQVEVTVPGLHFVPEDSPDEIGAALAYWIRAVRPTAA